MKRLQYFALTLATAVAVLLACDLSAQWGRTPFRRNMRTEFARIGNDFPVLLKYQPTDGSSYSGKVRKALDLAAVRP